MATGFMGGFFGRFRVGDPVAKVCNISDDDAIKNFIEGLTGVGCRVVKDPENRLKGCKIIVDGGSDITPPPDFNSPFARLGFPYGSDRFLFGVDLSADTVTVGAGAMRRAGTIHTCSAQDVTITADDQWIVWRATYDVGNDSWTLSIDANGVTSSTPPVDTDGDMVGPLYRVQFADGVVSSVVPWQHGIIVAGLFGAQ